MIAEKIFTFIQPHSFKLWRHSALLRAEVVRNKAYWIAQKPNSSFDYVKLDELKPTKFYSLLTTVYNESKTIESFLNSILHQVYKPLEVIICDGGSTDNTVFLIREWIEQNKTEFSIELICSQKCSISSGRNQAAKKAKSEILVFADAGTSLDKFWAERLLKAFINDVDFVCGWYKPIIETKLQKAFAWFVLPKLEAVDPEVFLPSARSMALKKEVFDATGGFPEHLSFAGEDSLFGIYAKSASREVAFVPDAYCYWHLPNGISKMYRTIYCYAKGDAESGGLFWSYYLVLIDKLGPLFVHLFFLILSFVLSLKSASFFYPTVVLFLTYVYRILSLVNSYAVFNQASLSDIFYRKIVLKFALIAQLLGFISGLFERNAVEQRRIGKRKYSIIFLPETHVFKKDQSLTNLILSKIKEGKYLTVIAAKSIGVAFRNASVENYLRSEFIVDAWLKKHKQFIDGEFEFIDFCQDSLSFELSKRINSLH